MKSRFQIFSSLNEKLIDINYKYIEYPYLCYEYANGSANMSPLEEINLRDDFNEDLVDYKKWSLDEIKKCFLKLIDFLDQNHELLKKDENWLINCIYTPKENAKELEALVNNLKELNSKGSYALVALYEY